MTIIKSNYNFLKSTKLIKVYFLKITKRLIQELLKIEVEVIDELFETISLIFSPDLLSYTIIVPWS